MWRMRTHLQPLQTVLEPPHTLFTHSCTNTSSFEQYGLPSTPLRNLLLALSFSLDILLPWCWSATMTPCVCIMIGPIRSKRAEEIMSLRN